MKGFKSELSVIRRRARSTDWKSVWEVGQDLTYTSLSGVDYTIPKGFFTDLASVRRIPVVYEIFGNTASEAAVLHDWLYCSGAVTRSEADRLFFEAAISTGEPAWRARIMYFAVRIMGRPRHKELKGKKCGKKVQA